MQSLREFFTSSSGLAPARQGLALGWVISVLTGITVLLGAKEVKADDDDSCASYEWEECSYSAGCSRATGGAKPLSCCPYELDRDCNIVAKDCYCAA